MSTDQIMEMAAESSRRMASEAGLIVLLAAELDRREGWRDEGATSLEAWIVERCGVSVATARAWARVSERISDLPHIATSLQSGDVSFDKARVVAEVATPETDEELSAKAKQCSVRELAELNRRAPTPPGAGSARDMRSVRFNDTFRTVTAQLPPESYAEVRASLESRAKNLPSDGETRWDQRLCDAFLQLVRGASPTSRGLRPRPYLVVVHAPIHLLLDSSGNPSALCGELEHHGLVSADTVRQIACDATIVLAADDDLGHTMYEGRARRYPSETQRREIFRRDRHCRFPGCTNATFVDAHHIIWWTPPHEGTTDLPNLALLCEHHHHLVHSKHWTMSGDANAELTFVGPSGRAMTSLPSPLWTKVSATK
jgi:hypothetical protein